MELHDALAVCVCVRACLQWGVTTLSLRGKEYPLKRIHFMKHRRPDDPMIL